MGAAATARCEADRTPRQVTLLLRPGDGRRRVLPPEQVLPPKRWPGLWTDEDKHMVVAAVRCGQVTLGQAMAAYEISLEEFAAWHGAFRHGPVPSASMVERRAMLGELWEWLKPG